MFGLSFWEIAIVLGIALIVLGPTKLPELARSLGKGIREFRKATEDFKSTVDDEMHRPEPPKQLPKQEDAAELLPPEASPAQESVPGPIKEEAQAVAKVDDESDESDESDEDAEPDAKKKEAVESGS